MKKWSRHLLAAGALALGMSAAHADDNNYENKLSILHST